MIITGSDSSAISEVKQHVFRIFEIKDLGPLRYFLDIEVASSPKGYFLSQGKYTNEVIHCAGLTDTKISDTPIELNVKLNSIDGIPLDDPTIYREFVGYLVYLTVTRPDLAYAVHVVSQFVSTPRSTHWVTLVRILRYPRGTIFQGLLLSSTSSLNLVAYADSDWAGDVNDRKSTSGFCMFLGNSLISWKSKKQLLLLALLPKLSTVLWLMLLLSLFGFIVFFLIWVPLSLLRPLSIVTTAVLFRLPTILSSMNGRNTLRLIITLSDSIYNLALSHFRSSLRLCNLRTSSPRLTLPLGFSFFFANSQCFLLKHLEFERGCENQAQP
ncbi:hypothetical protein CsSME_00006382 [Camellia sinensis var. sinensis]